MNCLEIVKSIEGKSNEERKEWICAYLSYLGVDFVRHKYEAGRYGKGENIFVPSNKKIEIGIGSHFDVVPGSPGANDNASAVAVTLDVLATCLEHPLKNIGVRYFFFDQEEIDLVGSQAYLRDHGIGNLKGLLNLELVGMGNKVGLWPFDDGKTTELSDLMKQEAQKDSATTFTFPSLHTNNADHLPFLFAGLNDAFTITCLSDGDLAATAEYFKAQAMGASDRDLFTLIHNAPLFKHYHQPTDKSEHLNNKSMELVSNLILKTLEVYNDKPRQ
ncbi:M28 family peptidase [Candidatus Woesearchaeota archaeon]|nr:M28 family peptidase [Candidatus Woesearchaeota archaeon]